MKTSLLVTSIFVGLLAGGEARAEFKLEKLVKQQLANRGARAALTEGEEAKPIRQAALRARIMKTTVVQQPDGSYKFESEEICKIDGQADVYDLRNQQIGINIGTRVQYCESTLEGEKVRVSIGAALALTHETIIDVPEDMKLAVAFLEVSQRPMKRYPSSVTAFGNRDINNKSFVSAMQPSMQWDCQPGDKPTCRPSMTEYFNAIASIED